MKKIIALCIVTTVIASSTGCGCLRRTRDFLCRGAYCGGSSVAAAPAPIPMMPMAAAPMAYDPGCSYSGYDPGCSYSVGYGGAPSYDSGWMPGGQACDSCSGGYSMPSYNGGYLSDPGASMTAPGPAAIE